MSDDRPWALHVVDNHRAVYGEKGLRHHERQAAQRTADKIYRRASCRVEHARTGELWHRRGGTWVKEREPNDPDWLAWRQRQELRASGADERPGPSS